MMRSILSLILLFCFISIARSETIDLNHLTTAERAVFLLIAVGLFFSPLIFKAVRKDAKKSIKSTGTGIFEGVKVTIGVVLSLIAIIVIGIAFSIFKIIATPLLYLLLITLTVVWLIAFLKGKL